MSTIADTPYTRRSSIVIAGRKKIGGVVVKQLEMIVKHQCRLVLNGGSIVKYLTHNITYITE